ncbi:MAG: D-glycero-beta-D-manno-heptose 1-phosphate adenylyltransferase [Candidatus Omnitrophica bacterium]|nr:D-glycero-beta-D-manno-heptose 1-phosphate adenylyltransferase [Candidatus Omnitrophota bacterium]
MSKIKSLEALSKQIDKLKKAGKVVVFTNGCFDILHYGHAKYLQDAKNKGDCLVVAVNSDSSVKRIKGNFRPIVSQKNRLGLLAALSSVDYLILFNEDNPLRLIRRIKPDILIKGADWNKANIVGSDFVKGYGGRVLTIKLVKGLSTTSLINKIVKAR